MTVVEHLRHELEGARRLGLAFEDAWPKSRRSALDNVAAGELHDWRFALKSTRAAWEAAYSESTIVEWASILREDREPLPVGFTSWCAWCGTPFTGPANGRALYCSRAHQRQAVHARDTLLVY